MSVFALPAVSSAIAQVHQQGLDRMDQRKQQRTAANEIDPAGIVASLERPKFGVERFIDEQINQGGGRVVSGMDKKTGAVYTSGRFKGMTRDQAAEQLRREYASMPDDQRMAYEQSAQNRDVTSAREQDALNAHRGAIATASGITAPGGARIPGAASGVEPGTAQGGHSPIGTAPGSPTLPLSTPRLTGMARNPAQAAAQPQGLDYLRPRDQVQARATAARANPGDYKKTMEFRANRDLPAPADSMENITRDFQASADAITNRSKKRPPRSNPLAGVLQTVGGGAGANS